MNKSLLITLIITCLLPILSNGQGVSITNTNTPPDTSAMLDIVSTDKGLLLPRMTTVQRNAIALPAQSLQIYNITDSCLQIYVGTQWNDIWCINTCIPSTAPTSATASVNPTCGGVTDLAVTGGLLGTGASWQWYSSSCGVTAVGSGSPLSVPPSSTTTYYVRAEGTCNTTACANVTVTVDTVPTGVTASVSPNPVCEGSTLTLTGGATGATGWSWTFRGVGCFHPTPLSGGNT